MLQNARLEEKELAVKLILKTDVVDSVYPVMIAYAEGKEPSVGRRRLIY